ncbi:hypothetical protein BFV98_26895 [Micromonospora sp. WMMB235]|nr:hypothetical protein BFV98_26895 [Micromonospora sp. WMMB235]
MPGDGLDDVRRDAQLRQQRDDGVPQVVQPDLGAAGFLSEAGEVQGEITSAKPRRVCCADIGVRWL